MRRSLLALVLAAAACGGKAKSTTPPPPLPEPKAAEAEPAKPAPQPEEPKEPAAPPVPQGPIEITLDAPKVEVKVVSAGKGKKAPLKFAPKAGTKTTAELALDFTGGQDGPPETGGKRDEVAPTVVLLADGEAKEVATDGATKFLFTVTGVDVKDKAGQKVPSAEFKGELGSLVGATISGTVGANGASSEMKFRVEKPDAKAEGAMQFVKLSMMPLWPILPTEPIAPGAKWTVTSQQKIADQLEVTKTVSYELVGKKGNAWTIKGTTKITGQDQDVQGAKLGNIGGDGAHEITLADGALVPAMKQNMATQFTITVTPPAGQGNGPIVIKFHVEQANTVTPKA